MEWLKEILVKHTKDDGTVDTEALNKEIKQEFPKHAVPKDQYNNIADSLKEANSTIKTLENKVQDNPEVQKELESYKAKAEHLESDNKQLVINQQVGNALRDAGAKDIEYATFKLGQLELDKDGNVKDLANKVKDLQSNLPDYFAAFDDKDKQSDPMDKFKTITPDPKEGNQTPSFTMAQVEKRTPQEINENWPAVSAALSQGGNE